MRDEESERECRPDAGEHDQLTEVGGTQTAARSQVQRAGKELATALMSLQGIVQAQDDQRHSPHEVDRRSAAAPPQHPEERARTERLQVPEGLDEGAVLVDVELVVVAQDRPARIVCRVRGQEERDSGKQDEEQHG